jgi:hypothetical protein
VKLDLLAGTVEFRDLSSDERRRAPFHDGRLRRDPSTSCKVELEALLSCLRDRPAAPAPVHYIFHTAFCGSTLLARYLDQPGLAAVYREPQPLAHLAWCRARGEVEGERLREIAAAMLRLVSSTAAPGEIPVIKLHDGCNTLIDSLLEIGPDSRGVVVHSDLPTFVLATLKSASRRRYVRDRIRWNDFDVIDGRSLDDLDQWVDAEAIAGLWLAQHRVCRRALERHADRLRSLDSRILYRRGPQALRAVAGHLGLEFSPGLVRRITRSTGKVHAKSGGRYRPFRRAVRDAVARRIRSNEIKAATDWCRSAMDDRAVPSGLPGPIALD